MVQVKGADGHVIPYDDAEARSPGPGPLVVVTNKFAASASEILAGAIQDYHRGLIVGDHTTHGKGTVQSMLDLGQQLFRLPNIADVGSLKITVQQFYRPSGDSTQNRGVVADIELPSLTTHMDVGEADLDYPLAFDRVPAAQFRPYQSVESTAVKMLAAASSSAWPSRTTSRRWSGRSPAMCRGRCSAIRSTRRISWTSGPISTPTRKKRSTESTRKQHDDREGLLSHRGDEHHRRLPEDAGPHHAGQPGRPGDSWSRSPCRSNGRTLRLRIKPASPAAAASEAGGVS